MSKLTKAAYKANLIQQLNAEREQKRAYGRAIAKQAMHNVSVPRVKTEEELIKDITSTTSYNYWLQVMEGDR